MLAGLGYIYCIFMANWNSWLWSWFPVGPTGIRFFFMFFVSIAVLLLRISQYHVGVRTSDSALQTFLQYALKFQTAETLFIYVGSSFIFSQIYMWSQSHNAGLEWVTYFLSDRARLNEKAIFFTTHFVLLGIYQALAHLYKDNDRLSIGVARVQDAKTHPVATIKSQKEEGTVQWKRLVADIPRIIVAAINQSVVGIMLSMFIYPIFLRPLFWRVMLMFLRPIYNLPRTNMLPSSLPWSFGSLGRLFSVSFMIMLLWTLTNAAFSIFLVKEPLKNGKPLTSESKDPNGCLLNGLKNKRYPYQCFAMWELAFIARDYPERRKVIFEDIDRKDGLMWTQVYTICLDIIKTIETRIDWYGKPPPEVIEQTTASIEEKKRTTAPPKETNIYTSTPPKKNFRVEVEKVVNQVTTSPGQGSQISPVAKRVMATAKQQLLKAQKEATGSDDPQSAFKELALRVLNSAVGWPFRQEYSRRLTKAALGSPHGEPSIYTNAINALSLLAIHSLNEDKYGNVQRDIANIIRTLTSVARKLETFGDKVGVHWTDVEAKKECPEVEAVQTALKEALGQLITEFEQYARELRLSLADVRLAKEAAGLQAVTPPGQPVMRQMR